MKRNECYYYDVIKKKDTRDIMGGLGIVLGLVHEKLLGSQAEVRAVGPASRRKPRLRGYSAIQAVFEGACLPPKETRKAKLDITDHHGKVRRIGKVRIPRSNKI